MEKPKTDLVGCELILLHKKDNWSNYIEKFSNLDIYYSQEYVNLFAEVEKGIPEACYYENEYGKVFYPYIKRKVEIMDGYFDIITPYGYGGPVLEGKQSVIQQFYFHFNTYCYNNNIITETVRLHPLLNNFEYIKDVMNVDYIRKTTAVDLTLSLDEIRKKYTSNNRRNIRKAISDGVYVQVSENKEDIEAFKNIYFETMDRNNALSFYYFDKTYFYNQLKDTLLSKPYLLLAKYQEQIIGGVLLIIGKDFAHYHLGASKTDYLYLRPNNLLFDYMVELSKSFGVKALHLGGGYKENDSLFKFKTSYSNNFNFNYYIGKNIFNNNIYNKLSQMVSNSKLQDVDNNYFPLYRKLK